MLFYLFLYCYIYIYLFICIYIIFYIISSIGENKHVESALLICKLTNQNGNANYGMLFVSSKNAAEICLLPYK